MTTKLSGDATHPVASNSSRQGQQNPRCVPAVGTMMYILADPHITDEETEALGCSGTCSKSSLCPLNFISLLRSQLSLLDSEIFKGMITALMTWLVTVLN